MSLSSFLLLKRKPTHFPPLQPAGSDCGLESLADGASQPKGWQSIKDGGGAADVTDALGDRCFSTSCFLWKASKHPAALRWKMPLGACPEEMHMWEHPWVTQFWGVLLLKLTNSWKLTVYKVYTVETYTSSPSFFDCEKNQTQNYFSPTNFGYQRGKVGGEG